MGIFWRKKKTRTHNNNNRRYGISKDREKLGNLLENTNWYNAEYMLAVVQCLLQLLWTIRFLNWRWATTALKQKPFKNHAKRFKDNRDMHLFSVEILFIRIKIATLYKLNATATNQSWSLHMFFSTAFYRPLPAENWTKWCSKFRSQMFISSTEIHSKFGNNIKMR